jgi:hypothetical protein
MTDSEQTSTSEPTIEEQTRAVLVNALDQLSSEVPGGKVRWSTTTLPTMLRPVLLDLDRHLKPPNPAPPPPPRDKPPKTSPPAKTLEAKRQEEQRFTSTPAELADAIRKGNL